MAEVKTLTDQVMARIVKDDIKGAFGLLKPYWAGLPEAEMEVAMNKLLDQRRLVAPRFGKTVGSVFVDQKTVADSVSYLLYIEKFEKHIIRWHFYFYRPKGTWHLNSFTFDDRVQALF